MKKLLLLAMVLGLLVSGCSISTFGVWKKEGATPTQVDQDRKECRDSLIGYPDIYKREVFDSCMETKGYRWGAEVRTYNWGSLGH